MTHSIPIPIPIPTPMGCLRNIGNGDVATPYESGAVIHCFHRNGRLHAAGAAGIEIGYPPFPNFARGTRRGP